MKIVASVDSNTVLVEMKKSEIAQCFNTSEHQMERDERNAFNPGQSFDLASRTSPLWRIDGLSDKMKRAQELVASLKVDCDSIVEALAAPAITVAVEEVKKKK